MSKFSPISFMLFLSLLTACGGGSGGDTSGGEPVIEVPNTAPTISGQALSIIVVNQPYLFTPSVVDSDSTNLSFSATNLPAWLMLNPATAQLSGTPMAADIAVYINITITVSDGEFSATLGPFSIEVKAATVASTLSPSNWPDYLATSRSVLPIWSKTLRRSNQTATELKTLLQTSDIINTAALGSGRNQAKVDEFMLGIETNASVYKEQVRVLTASVATEPNRLYWLIGNEVSSQHYSLTFNAWTPGGTAAAQTSTGRSFDQSYIPTWIEYVVAPTIEALLQAEADSGGDIAIVLGSITNASNPAARLWLDTAMNYTIVGTYAPTLKGKKVYELAEYFAFHYAVLKSTWEESFDDMKKWIGQGAVKGMLDTEEIGLQLINGGGAAEGSLTGLAHLIPWAINNNYSAEQVRLTYWSQSSAEPVEAMNLFLSNMGGGKLSVLSSPTLNASGDYEVVTFGGKPNSRAVIVSGLRDGVSPDITSISVPADGWMGDTTAVMWVYTLTGLTSKVVTPVLINGNYEITVNTKIDPLNVLVVYLQQ